MKDDLRLAEVFCGAGGFSSGAHAAGFKVSLAVDIDPVLTSSYSRNFPATKLLLADVGKLTGADLATHAGGQLDGLFGGPPCQGFSAIGLRNPADLRRQLLRHFFRLVAESKPLFFVMENVPGLMHPGNRDELDSALAILGDSYEVMPPTILDASEFGAATRRSRLFVVGTRKGACEAVSLDDVKLQRTKASTVGHAIADLSSAEFVGDDRDGFDTWQLPAGSPASAYASKLMAEGRQFTGNRVTNHTDDVAKRFATVAPGTTDKIGRHFKLAWDGLCPTLRAGTGSDRGSYQSVRPLHPTLPRVITVREAARLQGFKDSHYFHPTVWHSFRMIGNSVSPLMAAAIFRAIRSKVMQQPLTAAPLAANG
jgi:DNA (cytosine-5)-methyltransferase 1